MIQNIVEIYCLSCSLVKLIDEKILKKEKVGRKSVLTREEVVTLAVLKQQIGIQTNKQFYNFTKKNLKKDFPNLPSFANLF